MMFELRNGSKGARFAPFGFVVTLLAVFPTEIGYQDIGSLLAQQPGVAERSQQHIFASTRRSLQIASFNLPRPVGTMVPEAAPVRLASLDSQGFDITGSLGRNPLGQIARPWKEADFPVVVRNGKSDRLPLFVPSADISDTAAAPENPAPLAAPVAGAKAADAPASAPLDAELQAALQSPQLPQYDTPVAEAELSKVDPSAAIIAPPAKDSFSFQTSTVYFGNGSLGIETGSLQRWQPGEEPVIVTANPDPDMKVLAALPPEAAELTQGGESVASKGEVTGENQRPRTPAERLNLDVAARAKAEKCLTEVIYFEARGEAVRGQIAVAQVVMNRAFSGYYPNTVCGVVYQNKHRHLACQFTFACDNIRDTVKEPEMWERAKKIAKETLDGRIWLPEVGKSTHYHAYWVRPSWVNEMKKMYKTGVHTFYRPRAWGDGSNAPSWGTDAETRQISAQLADAAKSSAEVNASR